MKQWEYHIIVVNITKEEDLTRLNHLGAAGWEVVTFLGPPYGTVLLKRERV